MALSFRPARPADIPGLVALVQTAYRGEESRKGWTTEADLLGGRRTGADELMGIIAGPGSLMLIAEAGGELVGCCQLEQRPGDSAYLGMLSVRPERQRGGVGRALMAEAERLVAARWSATTMRMTVLRPRVELLAWYERRGYRPTGETAPFPYGDDRFGLPKVDDLEFVVLEKALPAVSRR